MPDFLCRAPCDGRLLIFVMTVMRGRGEAHTPSFVSGSLPDCANQAAEELPFVSKRRVASVAGPNRGGISRWRRWTRMEAVGAYVERIERTVLAHSRLLGDAAEHSIT